MYKFVKPLSFIESRLFNFPKATNNIKVTNSWGKERIMPISVVHNTGFDGFAITRLPANSIIFKKHPNMFVSEDILEVVKRWLGYREIGIWANMATYLANQPIDAFKDDSKERAQKLIKKYSSYLDLLSTETKQIMAKPYKKEDK